MTEECVQNIALCAASICPEVRSQVGHEAVGVVWEVASGDRDTSGMKTADEPVAAEAEGLHAGAMAHHLQAASA